jgi:ketosteroid isomerase-like protein
MNVEDIVRELADVAAIRDLARRYAHYVWQQDASGAVGLFTEHGEMDTGDRPVIRGRKALLEAYDEMFANSEFHPMVHNHVIELRGNRATGTCYLDLHAVVDGKDMIGSGYYHDRYARVGGEWKFQSRKLAMCYFVESSTKLTS